MTKAELNQARLERNKEILRLYNSGMNQVQLASAFGLSQSLISLVLIDMPKRAPVFNPGKHAANHNWRGGIITDRGYTSVLLPETDPFRCMCDKKGS